MKLDVSVVLANGQEVRAGELASFAVGASGQPVAVFSYDRGYLTLPGAYNLSPDLHFSAGEQTTPVHRQMFMGFEDASPDRWGTELLQAEWRAECRATGARYGRLTKMEVLARVPDNTRQGALRFRRAGDIVGSDARPEDARVVRWSDVISAAEALESGRETPEATQLLERMGGSSPGGARPKIHVLTEDGALHIAKLPQHSDRWDVSLWEAATLTMLSRAGVTVPAHRLVPIGEERSVLVLERFDRDGERRVGYASARTLLQLEDHDLDRRSYTELAEVLIRETSRRDVAELFVRVAVTILVTNADDHMRNHGVIRGKNGWGLAPAFDVNPSRHPSFESTPVSPGSDPMHRDIRELLAARDAFGLTEAAAVAALQRAELATRDWADIGVNLGADPDTLPFFAPAFEGANREWCRSL